MTDGAVRRRAVPAAWLLGGLALSATLTGCGEHTAPAAESAQYRCAGQQGALGARGVSSTTKTQLPDGTDLGLAQSSSNTGQVAVILSISGTQPRRERVRLGSTFAATGTGWRVSWICPDYVEVAPSAIVR